jgi:prolyl-tRNA synthetase
MICPVAQKKEGVLEKARELKDRLSAAGFRVRIDERDKMPGFKFADSEMRGIPLRVEIGPKDIQNGQAVLVRRDTHEKEAVSLEELEAKAGELLETIQKDMFEAAKKHLEAHTFSASTMDEMESILDNQKGFVKAMWCGSRECEEAVKEKTGASSRCIPFEQEHICDCCINCGKPAAKMVYWGRAY